MLKKCMYEKDVGLSLLKRNLKIISFGIDESLILLGLKRSVVIRSGGKLILLGLKKEVSLEIGEK